MEVGILLKIKSNNKLYEYLHTHSYYYLLLNRDSKNYDLLLSEYKKYNRDNNINKVIDTIDNVDMISNIIKMSN